MYAAQRNARTLLENFNRDDFDRTVLSAHLLTQASDGRRVEHAAHRKMGIQRGVDRGDQPHRGKRIPTEVEERVVDPDPLEPEYLGVDVGDDASRSRSEVPRNAAAENAGAGRALLSILPEAVSGNSSSATMCAGTMYSGSRALNR